jgi:Rrf2 family iron-sulfur cluster assembly transcriptional regulator
MTPYGKTAQHAIAAVSRLAQAYDPVRKAKLSSADIAESRGLPQPVVAKVLTILSQAGLVGGSPGPGGGYWLAKPPAEISFYDVAILFDRLDENLSCPFGPNWCGNGPRCPMHYQLEGLRTQIAEFLKRNTFAGFVGWDQHRGGPANGAAPTTSPAGGIPLTLVNTPAPAQPDHGGPKKKVRR